MNSMVKRFIPLLDRILVQKIKSDVGSKTKSGLFLPDSAKTSSNEALVLAVGPGRVTTAGETVPCVVKEGDTVVVPEYGGMALKLNDEEYHVYRNDDLIGILKE
ncbi:putative chaperonin [Cardiosporidium cionae]|uniref:Chaperonin n=1 Tax=Cardiosporidium cionae TaxID=476202 RepID=A0ABQ7JEX1_9APIC|nr:putative chaperonin [Cardiosporidium cionae]|eukprot:KAF8822578.1 putative chaperonin [Cardiosporidium cionae]